MPSLISSHRLRILRVKKDQFYWGHSKSFWNAYEMDGNDPSDGRWVQFSSAINRSHLSLCFLDDGGQAPKKKIQHPPSSTVMASDQPDVSGAGRGCQLPNNNNGTNSPRIQVSHPTNLKMPPRSPSRESIATEISVSSSLFLSECGGAGWNNKLPAHLTFLKAVPENQQLSAYLTPNRGPSPIPGGGGGGGRFLRVPGPSSMVGAGGRSVDGSGWWQEETDLNVIKSCATLSKALGLQKSFSTGDIVSLDDSGSPLHPIGNPYPSFSSPFR